MTIQFSAHQTCLYRRCSVTYEALTKGGKGIQSTIFRRNKMQVFLHTERSVFITVLVSDMAAAYQLLTIRLQVSTPDHMYSGIYSLLRVIALTTIP